MKNLSEYKRDKKRREVKNRFDAALNARLSAIGMQVFRKSQVRHARMIFALHLRKKQLISTDTLCKALVVIANR